MVLSVVAFYYLVKKRTDKLHFWFFILLFVTGWKLDIPSECKFTLFECIQLAPYASAQRMVELGLGLDYLRKTYKMDYRNMVIMQYSLMEWMVMGFDFAKHGTQMSDETIMAVFHTSRSVAYSEYLRLKQAMLTNSASKS